MWNTILALAAMTALPAVAHAQSFQTVATGVLTADAVYEQGVGAPTVVWDADEAQFVLFFEAAWSAPDCDDAWAIGKATSPDGVDWSVASPVVLPSPEAPCGARRPAAVQSPDGEIALFVNVVDRERDDRVARVEFLDQPVDRTETATRRNERAQLRAAGAKASGLRAVGNGRATAPPANRGNGRAELVLSTLPLKPELPTRQPTACLTLLPDLDGLIAPTVAVWDDQWILLGIRNDPNDQALVSARSWDGLSWSVDGMDAIAMGATPWSRDGTLSPSLLCKDASSWPWELYYGGWNGGESAWTYGISNTANAWYVTPAITTWSDDSAWLAWDAVKVGAATVVLYEELDADGLPRISVAATQPSWDPADAQPRACTSGG